MVNSLLVVDESRLELFFEKYFSKSLKISFSNASILKLDITEKIGTLTLIYSNPSRQNKKRYWVTNNESKITELGSSENLCQIYSEAFTEMEAKKVKNGKNWMNITNSCLIAFEERKFVNKSFKNPLGVVHSVYFLINTNPKTLDNGSDEKKAGEFFSNYLKGLTLDFAAVSDVKKSHDILTKFFEGVNQAITENTKIVVLPCNHPGKDGSGAFNNRDCDPNKCGTINVNEGVLPIDWTFYQSFYQDLRTTYIFSSRKGRKCRETDFLALFFEYYNNLSDIQKSKQEGLQKQEEELQNKQEEKEKEEELQKQEELQKEELQKEEELQKQEELQKEEEGLLQNQEEEEKEGLLQNQEKEKEGISKVYTLEGTLVEGGKKRTRKVYHQKKTIKRKQKKTKQKKTKENKKKYKN